MRPIDLDAIRKRAIAEPLKPLGLQYALNYALSAITRPEFFTEDQRMKLAFDAHRALRESDDVPIQAALDRLALLTLIDFQTQALLEVEQHEGRDESGPYASCCGAPHHTPGKPTHSADCPIDAALTAAGLDTQEKRDEARAKPGFRSHPAP